MMWAEAAAALILAFLAGLAAGVIITALAARNGMEDHKE